MTTAKNFKITLFVIIILVCAPLIVNEAADLKSVEPKAVEQKTKVTTPAIQNTGPGALQNLPNPARVDVKNLQETPAAISRHELVRTAPVVEKPKPLVYNNYYNYDYTDEDLRILYKIVEAEASNEDDKGKILVVNVIMNRIIHPDQFPDTIYEVVFANQQFEPTRNGAFEKATPTENTKECVLRALNGETYTIDATYFKAITAPPGWHERALLFLFNHGGHDFYK